MKVILFICLVSIIFYGCTKKQEKTNVMAESEIMVEAEPKVIETQEDFSNITEDFVYFGIANNTGISVRKKPDINSELYGKINSGDLVEVSKRTLKKYIINGVEDYWIYIKVRDNPDNYCEGWIFMPFVNEYIYEEQQPVIYCGTDTVIPYSDISTYEERISYFFSHAFRVENSIGEILSKFGKPEQIKVKHGKNRFDDSYDSVYQFYYIGLEMTIYSVSHLNKVILLDRTITEPKYLCIWDIKAGTSKEEIIKIFGESESRNNNSFNYFSIYNEWPSNIYFTFEDDKVIEIFMPDNLD